MAPPRKPTQIKRLEGTYRADRAPEREPTPRRGKPKAPKWLGDNGRNVWRELSKRLDEMQVLTVADGVALSLLADAYDEWLEARSEVRGNGITYESETQNGIIKRPHPAVAIRADAWRRVLTMLAQFGLTPSARTRINAPITTPTTDASADFLFNPTVVGRIG